MYSALDMDLPEQEILYRWLEMNTYPFCERANFTSKIY